MSVNDEVVAYLDDDEAQPITFGRLKDAAWSEDADAIAYMAELAEAGYEPASHSLRTLRDFSEARASGLDIADFTPSVPEPPAAEPATPKNYGADIYAAIDDHNFSGAGA